MLMSRCLTEGGTAHNEQRVEIEYREDIEKGVMRTVKLNAPYESTGVIVDDNTGDE